MIRFNAPVPSYVNVSAAALSGHCTGKLALSNFISQRRSSQPQRSSPTLILLWDICYEQYVATPDSESFSVEYDDDDDPIELVHFDAATRHRRCLFQLLRPKRSSV
jgi:hypothetical protein